MWLVLVGGTVVLKISVSVRVLIINLGCGATPIRVHRHLAFGPSRLNRTVGALGSGGDVLRGIVLSAYGQARVCTIISRLRANHCCVGRFLTRRFGVSRDRFSPFLFVCRRSKTVRRLFGMTYNLGSVVLNRARVLKRMEADFLRTRSRGAAKAIFGRLFGRTMALTGQTRSRARVKTGTISIDCTTIRLTGGVFKSLRGGRILVLKTNGVKRLTVRGLRTGKTDGMAIVGHAFRGTRSLTDHCTNRTGALRRLRYTLIRTSVLVDSAKTGRFIIAGRVVTCTRGVHGNGPLFVISVTIPESLSPGLTSLSDIFLCSVSSLRNVIRTGLRRHGGTTRGVRLVVRKSVIRFGR